MVFILFILYCAHLIVPLQKVLTLDYKNKNYFLFCIVLT